MSTEKLKKSVILPAPKSSSLENALASAFSFLVVSLLVNIILIAQYSQQKYNKEWWYHAYFAQRDRSISLEHKIDDLEQKLDGLQPDAITSASDGEIKARWIADEQSSDYLMCNPVAFDGLLFLSPLVLELRYWQYPVCRSEFARDFVFNQNEVSRTIFCAYLAKIRTRQSWPLSTLNR